ncbi:MAG TPA: GWxTD domain-containing protein [Gemmatimonadaceae bacterium]|nr:GWxTD domain-containing protein [Gemmatimonadaceae bacterium]
MLDITRLRSLVTRSRVVRRSAAALALATFVGACGRRPPVDRGATPAGRGPAVPSALDVSRLYREVGLFVETTPVPFVGATHAFASESPDTTLVLLTLSLPNRALTFVREGDHYRAGYDVIVDARRGGSSARREQGRQTVRVASYKETSRGDESLIFQQYLRLAPETYALNLTVRDVESGRTTTRDLNVTVPRIATPGLSSAVPVYEAEPRLRRDTLPVLVPNPRATAVFGQDSSLMIYLERYGGTGPVQAAVRDARGVELWRDSVPLPSNATMTSGMVTLPITTLGPGIDTFVAWTAGGRDTTRTRLVVSFGEGIAITSFEEMLSFLRYFAPGETLQPLRNAAPADRGRAWLAFLHATDPDPSTAEHEALRDYFIRIEQANLRYREEGGPGWLTDRGKVFISLGDPDQIYEQGQGDIAQRGRVQIWEYAQYRTQLVFIDQSGFGRYRLTTTSELEFQSLVRRIRQR